MVRRIPTLPPTRTFMSVMTVTMSELASTTMEPTCLVVANTDMKKQPDRYSRNVDLLNELRVAAKGRCNLQPHRASTLPKWRRREGKTTMARVRDVQGN